MLSYESTASRCFTVMCHSCESTLLVDYEIDEGDSVHCIHCDSDTRIAEVEEPQPSNDSGSPIVIVVNDHHLLRSQPNA